MTTNVAPNIDACVRTQRFKMQVRLAFAIHLANSWGVCLGGIGTVESGATGDRVNVATARRTEQAAGPDIVVGDIFFCTQLGRVGSEGSGTIGMSCWATACNGGDAICDWVSLPSTDHPVISFNLFRMEAVNGATRFEQIGQSWVKHAHGTENADDCGFGCQNGGDFHHVPPGCSDAYAAQQFEPCNLAPRSMINPYTGAMPDGSALPDGGGCNSNYPSNDHRDHVHSAISHRLQVDDVDLMPSLNPGARYFAENQYIVPHEFAAGNGNQNNNVSYQELNAAGPAGGTFTFAPINSTFVEHPAIDAWTAASQSLIEPAPLEDGQAILAYEATDLGDGQWHYEYAIYNENLDRAILSFWVPVASSINVSNVGFHAPKNHAPEPHSQSYSNTPWLSTRLGNGVFWTTRALAQDPNANAIHWGTMYNFRFDANAPPQSVLSRVSFFKTGAAIAVQTIGPRLNANDCNGNGVSDACDINCNAPGCNVSGCGSSSDCDVNGVPDECQFDCNGNSVPDECETDCDANGVADSCDLAAGYATDCQHNGVPDVCDIAAGVSMDVQPPDGIPDECEFIPAARGEPNGVGKNRYISFAIDPAGLGTQTAISIELIQLMHPLPPNPPQFPPMDFSAMEGQTRFVGLVEDCAESDNPPTTFKCASMQCMPTYQDWAAVLGSATLHVSGSEVIPSSTYSIRHLPFACRGAESACTAVSDPLVVTTQRWGDVIVPFQDSQSPLTQPNISDVAAIADKFKNLPTAIPAARTDLNPAIPDGFTNIADIASAVDSFKGLAYVFNMGNCP